MHWKRYERLRSEHDRAQDLFVIMCAARTSSAAPAKLPRSTTRSENGHIACCTGYSGNFFMSDRNSLPRLFGSCKRSRLCVAARLSRHGTNSVNTLRKTRFWAAIAVAALLLLGIAGWGNTNANTKNLEAPGPRIDPFQMMLNAENLPTQELRGGVYGLSR